MDYESDTECIWKIQVPHNAALRLKFGEFDTECLHDYLEIHHLDTAAGTITRCATLVRFSHCIILFTSYHIALIACADT